MLNLNILDATPRHHDGRGVPWSYLIVFHDWTSMIWWITGTIQNKEHPYCSKAEEE